ncbi:MAG TPA: nuclear transport factor 2 family protein [Terriglobales bacterium]
MTIRTSIRVVIIASLIVAGFAAASARSSKKSQSDVAAIKSRAEQVWKAYETLDASKARPFYSSAPNDVYFDIAPLQYRGIDAYQQGVAQLLKTFRSISFQHNGDLEIHPVGNQAWCTETLTAGIVHADGNKGNLQIRWTAIWEKQNGNWVIVHEHVSAPLGAQPEREQNIRTDQK